MKLASDIVGSEAGPLEQLVDARWLMAYSAGLGETDARFYDTTAPGGILAHPLFPVCYEWPIAQPLRELAALRPLFPRLLHAQHDLIIHRAPRAGEQMQVSARIVAVVQRKPGAFVVFRFAARDAAGERVTTTDFGALYRGVTVEGGDRRSTDDLSDPPLHEAQLEPAGEIPIAANAAHVYTECARIWNPIHTDRAYALAAGLPGIILHGTATLALSLSRAAAATGADLAAVRRIQCRFSGMVPMPSTLAVFAAARQKAILFETRNHRGEALISRGVLLLH